MSITYNSTWAPLPSTTRATPVHLSYDVKSDRLAYPNGKAIYLRSISNPAEVYQFNNHNYQTTVAKFAPSGFYVASGDESGNVKVWDCVGDDHIVKGDYPVINGRINDLEWDADSKRIIAVGNGKERFGHCFTFDSGNTVGEISGHGAQISAVTIKPTRPFRAATVGEDAALVFLSSPPYKFVSSVRNKHTNFVRDVAYSKDGNFIVSVGADKKIVVYDGKSGEYLKTISDPQLTGESAHEMGVFGVSWSLDNPEEFVTCSTDSTVKLWNVTSGELLKVWILPKSLENQHLGIVYTKDYIVSLTYNGNLNYFTKESDLPVQVIKGHQKSITSLTVLGNSVFTGSYDGRICQWDVSKKTGSASYISGKGHTNLITDLVSAGDSVITSSWDDKVLKIDSSLEYETSSEFKLDSQPKRVSSVNSKGVYGVVTSDSELIIVDSSSNTKVTSKKLPFDVSTIDINDEYVIIGDDRSFNVHFLSVSDLSPVSSHALKLNYKPTYIKISPDSLYVAVGDSSGKIVLYNIKDKAIQTSRWGLHTAMVNSISWRSDSKFVVTGSLDTNIIIYSVDRPVKTVKALNCHKFGVNSAAWIDDNEIVSVGADSAIKLWEVKNIV
ncbi:Aip1 protein [Saccharomycopsis crataegensis]|uniref:Aip1 protein n=1 Tax=Saccharomycopsis crataegensis TaxID=43959 RepID=A0AAV5QUB3_9ASCO|nr:Aip1 protein [Saccharomycopsis crataegensis]